MMDIHLLILLFTAVLSSAQLGDCQESSGTAAIFSGRELLEAAAFFDNGKGNVMYSDVVKAFANGQLKQLADKVAASTPYNKQAFNNYTLKYQEANKKVKSSANGILDADEAYADLPQVGQVALADADADVVTSSDGPDKVAQWADAIANDTTDGCNKLKPIMLAAQQEAQQDNMTESFQKGIAGSQDVCNCLYGSSSTLCSQNDGSIYPEVSNLLNQASLGLGTTNGRRLLSKYARALSRSIAAIV